MVKDEKGMALLVSIMVMFLALTLTAACLTLVSNERVLASNHQNSTQALYLAEAGAERAIPELEELWTTSNWDGIGSKDKPIFLDKGIYWVVPRDKTGQSRIIDSYGKVGNSQKKLTFTVQLKKLDPIFESALYGGTWVGGLGTVNGDVTTKNIGWLMDTFGNVKGNIKRVSTTSLPTLDEKLYSNAPPLPGLILSHGNYHLTKDISLNNGVYFVDRPLIVDEGVKISGSGTIYVKGDVVIRECVQIKDEQNPDKSSCAILTVPPDQPSNSNNPGGSIKVEADAIVNGVLYAAGYKDPLEWLADFTGWDTPKISIQIESGAKVNGCAVGKEGVWVRDQLFKPSSVTTYNSNRIYNGQIKIPIGSGSPFTIKGWKYD